MNDQHRPAPRNFGKPQQAPSKPYKSKPSLLQAVKELVKMIETLRSINQPTHTLNPLRRQLREAMEDLPRIAENCAERYIIAWGLHGDRWYPVHAYEDCNPNSIFAGGIFGATRHLDGSSSQGPFNRFEWAHCCADDTVNYHWLEDEEEPEPVKEEESYDHVPEG